MPCENIGLNGNNLTSHIVLYSNQRNQIMLYYAK